jgi:hypothetical protein
VLQKQVRRQR